MTARIELEEFASSGIPSNLASSDSEGRELRLEISLKLKMPEPLQHRVQRRDETAD